MLDQPDMLVMHKASVSITAEALFDADLAVEMSRVQQDMAHRLGALATRAGGDPSATDVDADYAGRVLLAIFEGFRLQKLLDPSIDTARFVATVLQLTFGKTPESPTRDT